MRPVRVLSMRSKILLSCVVFLLIALVMQMLLFQNYSGDIIYAQARRMSEGALTNLQDDLYALYKQTEGSLIQVYADTKLVHDFSADLDAAVLSKKYSSVTYDMAYSAFDAAQNLAALYLYTEDHVLISSYRHAQTPMYSYPEDLYQGTMDAGQEVVRRFVTSDEHAMLISVYYNTQRNARLVRHVLKIFAGDGRTVGYLVADLGSKAFDQLLSKYRYSEEYLLWLQCPGDAPILVGGENEGNRMVFDGASETIGAGRTPELPSGYELFSAAQRKYQMNAYLVMPQSALMENQRALNRVTLIVCLLIVLLFSLLFLLVSRGLTHSLTYMVRTMNRIKAGQKGIRMEKLQGDEFGQLGHAFNDMLDQIDIQTQREMQSQLVLNDARYKALQAQINPHFLYNTLDTMGGIASAAKTDMVAVLCRALSGMFRYSLDMTDTYATIGDELVHLKNYMLIMNVRMQGAIELDVRIPDELMDYKLPRLTLQPLVENAIQHGLKNKRGDKHILVSAERVGEWLLVSVMDDGVGMDTAEINHRLQADDSDALQRAGSIGLSNIHARLRLLLGAQSGLSVADAPEGGSVVTLTMKVDEEANEHG